MRGTLVALVLPALVRGRPTWMWFGDSYGFAQPSYQPGVYNWDAANTFCSEKGGLLCRWEQMCTTAGLISTTAMFSSFPGAYTGDNWTPYRGERYHWLNTGSARQCMKEGPNQYDDDDNTWQSYSWCCSHPFVCCDLDDDDDGGGGLSGGAVIGLVLGILFGGVALGLMAIKTCRNEAEKKAEANSAPLAGANQPAPAQAAVAQAHVDVAVASSQQIELGSVASGTVKPAFGSKFDPNTGAPISKFDPQTGEQNW